MTRTPMHRYCVQFPGRLGLVEIASRRSPWLWNLGPEEPCNIGEAVFESRVVLRDVLSAQRRPCWSSSQRLPPIAEIVDFPCVCVFA